MNNPSNVTKNAPKPIITDSVAQEITDAFQVLFNALNTYGEQVAPTFADADIAGWERVGARALNAYKARLTHLREQEVAEFRQGVRDAIVPHIDRARQDKAEYDALSPTLRARLGAFQTYILVPLSDVSDVFPQGTSVSEMVKKLTTMNYKVSKSANGAYSIRQELPASITGVTPASK
jgi:hypothetical protein